MLQPHYDRGALFYVSDELNGFELAVDLALDNVATIKDYRTPVNLRKQREVHLE